MLRKAYKQSPWEDGEAATFADTENCPLCVNSHVYSIFWTSRLFFLCQVNNICRPSLQDCCHLRLNSLLCKHERFEEGTAPVSPAHHACSSKDRSIA